MPSVLASSEGEASASTARGARTFLLIQVLRGVAALMVVWHHATLMENERLDPTRGVWLSGAGGVDLFFVISGFVMVLSSSSLSGVDHPVRTFVLRRVERVVPMYWLVTTVKLSLVLLLPSFVSRVLHGTWNIAASYLFLPSANATGTIHPVLIVGWTLNYEAAFYGLVALCLALRVRLVPSLTVCLAALGVAGWVLGADMPILLSEINPLLFEFGYGALLAGMLPRLRAHRRWEVAGCWMLILAGFAVIQWNPQEVVRASRPFVWGLAAMAVVGAAIALEETAGKRMPRWLLEVGNASYSNYLVHTLVLAAIGFLWTRSSAGLHRGWFLETSLLVVVCALAAEVVYRRVELPITRWFKKQRA